MGGVNGCGWGGASQLRLLAKWQSFDSPSLLNRFLATWRRASFCFLSVNSLWKASVLERTDELKRRMKRILSWSLDVNLCGEGVEGVV